MSNPNKISSPDKHQVTPHLAAIAALGLVGFNVERGTANLPPTHELPPEQAQPDQQSPAEAPKR